MRIFGDLCRGTPCTMLPPSSASLSRASQGYIGFLRQSLQNKQCFHSQYIHTCLLHATAENDGLGRAVFGITRRDKEGFVEVAPTSI